MKGFMLAAPASGSGKTVLTLGLLRALQRSGVALAPAKAGPDYIDPAFHQAACGQTSFNLDCWAMRPGLLHTLASRITADGGTLVVEAMMGLFDGAADGSGSAAALAHALGLPVILVVDCAKLSHSIAPLVYGFTNYRRDIAIAGLVLNKVGSDRHEAMLRAALAPLPVPVIGVVRRSKALELPERHLGLVQAQEHGHEKLDAFMEQAASLVAAGMDMEKLVQIGGMRRPLADAAAAPLMPMGNRIAVACDDAFRFVYPHLLSGWRSAGADLSFFSPLGDESPAADADAIYLPGGYPELHAGRLAAAARFKQALRRAAARNVPVYGECGGYMALGEMLEDADGKTHEMLGLLPLATSFKAPELHLGYRRVVPEKGFFWQGQLRGHEFHYATVIRQGNAAPLFRAADALGGELGAVGLRHGSVSGSFIHIMDFEEGGASHHDT